MGKYSFDSRKITKGGVFFALKGKRVDGHDFLSEAAERGALQAYVDATYCGPSYGMQLIPCECVLSTLHALAQEKIKTHKPKIIAVTGSVGKTTVKEFITHLLAGQFAVKKNKGNANSQLGLPTEILNWQGKENLVVLEMGMTQKGELKKLVQIAPPDMAIITKITEAHIAFFSSLERIAEAKAEIIHPLHTKEAILGNGVQTFPSFQNLSIPVYAFGKTSQEYRIQYEQGNYLITEGQKKFRIDPPFQAQHILENVSLAVCVARKMGVSWEVIQKRIPSLSLEKHRFAVIEKKGVTWIDDTYNGSPTSIRAAIQNLPQVSGRKIAILGEMNELGGQFDEYMEQVVLDAMQHIDLLIGYGEKSKQVVKRYCSCGKKGIHTLMFSQLKQWFEEIPKKGDLVFVKGANTNQLWKLFE